MRELHYGSDVLLVSSDVCEAVFDYAVALANAGRTDRVAVPVLEGAKRGFSNLLLGPATQLFCTASPEHEPAVDLDDAGLIADLQAKTARLAATPTMITASAGGNRHSLDAFDLDVELV